MLLLIFSIGCESYSSKKPLLYISQHNDPSSHILKKGYNSYVHRAFLKDGTELGIIQMKDGSSSKYWFRSHHHADDMGGTWFFMSDGTKAYMAGWFCCELQLPEQQFESLADLKKFIKKYHRIKP
jgi:hypothetical protein